MWPAVQRIDETLFPLILLPYNIILHDDPEKQANGLLDIKETRFDFLNYG
jgi:hypothetical protein